MSGQTNFHHQTTAPLSGFSDILTARLTTCMRRCLDSAASKSMIKALTGWETVYIAHHPSAKTKY